MDIAIADFIFSNGFPMSLVECAKFHKLIQSARHIPSKYTPPYREKMAGPLLEDIYQSTYDEQMCVCVCVSGLRFQGGVL